MRLVQVRIHIPSYLSSVDYRLRKVAGTSRESIHKCPLLGSPPPTASCRAIPSPEEFYELCRMSPAHWGLRDQTSDPADRQRYDDRRMTLVAILPFHAS